MNLEQEHLKEQEKAVHCELWSAIGQTQLRRINDTMSA